MIIAIGIDTVDVERIENALQNPRFAKRILTERELKVSFSPSRFAGRWAAKEAIWKCLPHLTSWHQVEIENDELGKPIARVPLPPGTRLHLTISHERNIASAFAILESIGPS